jgi:hypothetical protein
MEVGGLAAVREEAASGGRDRGGGYGQNAQVARVAVVDTNQFRVITQSVKKTDANDAQLLALYLAKGLLPGGAHER